MSWKLLGQAVLIAGLGLALSFFLWGRRKGQDRQDPGLPGNPVRPGQDPSLAHPPPNPSPPLPTGGGQGKGGALEGPGKEFQTTFLYPDSKLTAEPNFLDLGVVDPDSVHTLTFTVKNPVAKVIKILKVHPGCLCTSAKTDKDILPPQGTVQLEVRYQAQRKPQVQIITVRLETDEEPGAALKLSFKAKVHQEVLLNPEGIKFGVLFPGERREASMNAVHFENKPFRILAIELPGRKDIEFRFQPVEGTGLSAYRITAVFHGTLELKEIKETAAILTDLPRAKAIPFEVTGVVKPDVIVGPERISSTRNRDGSIDPFVLYLRRPQPSPLTVAGVADSMNRPIRFEAKEEHGQRVRLTISFTGPTGQPDKPLAGALVISIQNLSGTLTVPYTVGPVFRPKEELPGEPKF